MQWLIKKYPQWQLLLTFVNYSKDFSVDSFLGDSFPAVKLRFFSWLSWASQPGELRHPSFKSFRINKRRTSRGEVFTGPLPHPPVGRWLQMIFMRRKTRTPISSKLVGGFKMFQRCFSISLIWDSLGYIILYNPSHWRSHIFQDGYRTTNQKMIMEIVSLGSLGQGLKETEFAAWHWFSTVNGPPWDSRAPGQAGRSAECFLSAS